MNKTLQTICAIFIWAFVIFVCCLCLSGCSRKTPVETAFNDVQQAVVAVKDSLPPECQTSAVMEKLETIESKRQVAESVCEAKIKDAQIKYERVLWLVFAVFLVFFTKKIIKL